MVKGEFVRGEEKGEEEKVESPSALGFPFFSLSSWV